ncbi:hypothetical protein B0H66DRAFT_477694, partial [Apodospora peruviana]
TKTCRNYTIPLTVASNNLIFGLPKFLTEFDVADWVDVITNRNPAIAGSLICGAENVTAKCSISATFCQPAKGEITRTRRLCWWLPMVLAYWDPPALDKSKYSFVEHAISQGYSVFYYDRLGVGESSLVSGYVSQLSNRISILTQLTKLVKQGLYVGDLGKPDKVVLLGHNFGSSAVFEAVSADIGLADGVVLTGFSVNKTYLNGIDTGEALGVRIAALQSPKKWAKLDSGYLTSVDVYSNVAIFFKAPDYDPAIAGYSEATKQPASVMEFLTSQAIGANPPLKYKGVAMIISSKFDFPWCTGDCDAILENPGAEYFRGTKAFKAVSYPGAGHGLNLHLNAKGSFEEITDFLSANGL